MENRSFATLEDDKYFFAMNGANEVFRRSQFWNEAPHQHSEIRNPKSEFRNRSHAVQMTFPALTR